MSPSYKLLHLGMPNDIALGRCDYSHMLARFAGLKHLERDSPLHAAARNGNAALARELLSGKVNVNWRNARGETALHACCSPGGAVVGKRAVATLLLRQRNLHISAVDAKGRTASDLAEDLVVMTMLQGAQQVRCLAWCANTSGAHALFNSRDQTCRQSARS